MTAVGTCGAGRQSSVRRRGVTALADQPSAGFVTGRIIGINNQRCAEVVAAGADIHEVCRSADHDNLCGVGVGLCL